MPLIKILLIKGFLNALHYSNFRANLGMEWLDC